MACFDHFFACFDIFIFVVHNQVPETRQETVYTFDTAVIPLCIQFRRTYKQFVHSQRITAVIAYQIIRRNDISFGLAHLDTVLTGNHTLIEQFVERFVKIDHSDIVQELGIETRVQKMQYSMLYTADVHIYRKVLVCFFFGYQFIIVMWIYITQEIPGRTCPLRHGVCLTFCGGTTFRACCSLPSLRSLPAVIRRYRSAR